jgi:hypothetical protein
MCHCPNTFGTQCIYFYHYSIPEHCKYGTGTDPVYSFFLSSVLFLCVSVLPCNFLYYIVIVTELLGSEWGSRSQRWSERGSGGQWESSGSDWGFRGQRESWRRSEGGSGGERGSEEVSVLHDSLQTESSSSSRPHITTARLPGCLALD